MHIKWTNDLTSSIYRDALLIRYEVFVNEQNVPRDLEIDDLEALSLHGVIYHSQQPIATVRLYSLNPKHLKVQRVAVLQKFRKHGVGRFLMKNVEEKAQELEVSQLILDSQNQAIPFYEKLNFRITGSEFLDADIPHHRMIKNIHKNISPQS